MSLRPIPRTAFLSLVSFAILCPPLLADARPPERTLTPFEAIIERIRAAAASEEWKKDGWTDAALESQLTTLVQAAGAATGKQLRLPVTFQDIKARREARQPVMKGGVLSVYGKTAEVTFVNKSILLVDGSLRVAFANDCLIIARGVVDISHGDRNLILAGQHVNISHDGSDGIRAQRGANGVAAPPADSSLIFCGGSIAISHGTGTVCSAPLYIDISHATQVDFLASPNIQMGNHTDCNHHKAFVSPLPIPAHIPFPKSLFTLRQVVADDDRSQQLITVERNSREYVLRPGSEIIDEQGQPNPSWKGWRLDFICDNIASFSDGQSDLVARLPK